MYSCKIFVRFRRRIFFIFAASWSLLFFANVGRAADSIWNNPNGGYWSSSFNWLNLNAPNSNNVYITNSGTYTVILDVPATVNVLTLGGSIGNGIQTLATSTNNLLLNGSINGSLVVNPSGVLNVGKANPGLLGSLISLLVQGPLPSINAGTILAQSGLLFQGNLTLSPTSDLQFSISSNAPNGTLTVANGSIFLGGTLTPSLVNGFVPALGRQFRVLNWPGENSRHGGFSQTNGTFNLGGGFYLQGIADYAGLSLVVKTTNSPPLPPPTNLVDQVAAPGDTASFFISPLGTPPFNFQWMFDTTNISGQNGSSLILTNVALTNAGSYCVSVTDASNVVQTYCATLSVFQPPVITALSTNQNVSAGNNVTFTVGAGGDGPFQYQWRLNGANIFGATNSTLTISNAQPADGGSYSVAISNPVRSETSSNAVLKVTATSANFADNFANAGTISGSGFIRSGSNTIATVEPGEPLHAGKIGGHSVWLRWTAPSGGWVTLNTVGSSFDTLLGVYSGSNVSNLTAVASDDDRGGFFTSQASFNALAGTNYYIAVDGRAGQTGNIVLALSLTNIIQTPIILQQPDDLTVAPGGSATFTASATNTSGMTYQWYFNDWLAVSGATNATLTITNVDRRNLGPYSVEITGTNGQIVDSTHAFLEISASSSAHSFDKLQDLLDSDAAAAASHGILRHNDSSSSGFPSVSAGGFGSQNINNFNSTTDSGDPSSSGTTGGSSRWYELNATSNATFIVDTIGSDFDTTLGIYTGSDVFSLTQIAYDNNGAPDGVRSRVAFSAVSGTRYLIDVDGADGASGNANVNWKLGIAPTATNFNSSLFPNQGSNLELQAGATNGVPSPTYQWRLNGTNIVGATNATLTLTGIQYAQGGVYSVVAGNFIGAVTNTIATVTVQVPLQLQLLGADGFKLSGTFTQAVVLERNNNLTSSVWTPLITNPGANTMLNYTDTSSSSTTQAFYRFKSWP